MTPVPVTFRPANHDFLNALGQKLTQVHRQLQTVQCTTGSIGSGLRVKFLQTPKKKAFSSVKPIFEDQGWQMSFSTQLYRHTSSHLHLWIQFCPWPTQFRKDFVFLGLFLFTAA